MKKSEVTVYISTGFDGRSGDDVIAYKSNLVERIAKETYCPVVCCNLSDDESTLIQDFVGRIFELSKADYLVLGRGWNKSDICRLEKDIAEHFGIPILSLRCLGPGDWKWVRYFVDSTGLNADESQLKIRKIIESNKSSFEVFDDLCGAFGQDRVSCEEAFCRSELVCKFGPNRRVDFEVSCEGKD